MSSHRNSTFDNMSPLSECGGGCPAWPQDVSAAGGAGEDWARRRDCMRRLKNTRRGGERKGQIVRATVPRGCVSKKLHPLGSTRSANSSDDPRTAVPPKGGPKRGDATMSSCRSRHLCSESPQRFASFQIPPLRAPPLRGTAKKKKASPVHGQPRARRSASLRTPWHGWVRCARRRLRMYIYMCVCVYVHIFTYVYMHIYICVDLCMCIHVYISKHNPHI